MKRVVYLFIVSIAIGLATSCKKQENLGGNSTIEQADNQIQFAQGFSLHNYENFSVVYVGQPYNDAKETYKYVLAKQGVVIPDSLRDASLVRIPVQRLVGTSTTHLPAIELLGEQNTLVGFPGLDYISSPVFRTLIQNNNIVELGSNEQLNTEKVIDLQPDVIIGFSMDHANKVYENLMHSGLAVIYNGDWVEQSPLGKAEWIKLFGALYDQQPVAQRLFNQIVNQYNEVLLTLNTVQDKPTCFSGVMYQDVWYLPEGGSWAGIYFTQAKSNYLWNDTKGTGSLALGFEQVFDKAQQADFWINPGHYETLDELKKANIHYSEFDAFKNKKVYSFAMTKGSTGGTVFYELGPSRPDLVLKDLAAIFHPELFEDHQLVFYRQLQ